MHKSQNFTDVDIEKFNVQMTQDLRKIYKSLRLLFNFLNISYEYYSAKGLYMLLENNSFSNSHLNMHNLDFIKYNLTQCQLNSTRVSVKSKLIKSSKSLLSKEELLYCIALFIKQESCAEVFYFYSENSSILEIFLNEHQNVLSYIFYLRYHLKKILKKSKASKIQSSNNFFDQIISNEDTIEKDLIDDYFNKTSLKKIFVHEFRTYFTQRELECVYFLCHGKTYKEIGKILSIADRTVNSYLGRVKNKTLCKSTSEVIMHFEKIISIYCPKEKIKW